MNVIDKAVEIVIAEGECEVPQFNEYGGVDVWTQEQTGYITNRTATYFAEGVRIATEDGQINIYKFVGNQLLATKISLVGSISTDLLASIIKELLFSQSLKIQVGA